MGPHSYSERVEGVKTWVCRVMVIFVCNADSPGKEKEGQQLTVVAVGELSPAHGARLPSRASHVQAKSHHKAEPWNFISKIS